MVTVKKQVATSAPKKAVTKKSSPSTQVANPKGEIIKPITPTKLAAGNEIVRPSSGYFSQVTSNIGPQPYITAVHGVGGVGKTSWAAHAPKPVFLIDDQELGIFDLMSSGQIDFEAQVLPKAGSWTQMMDMLDEVENSGASLGYETLILDSSTGFEYLCFKHHCDEAFDGDWSRRGFFNYMQGPKNAAKTIWPEFLRKLLAIRANGMNVILIAHSQIKNFSNPEGPDYERWIPYLDKETWAITFRVMENVLFMNYYVDVETGKDKVSRGKGKGNQRYLYTTWSAVHDAKNRWGLPPTIPMGDSAKEAYDNFAQYTSQNAS